MEKEWPRLAQRLCSKSCWLNLDGSNDLPVETAWPFVYNEEEAARDIQVPSRATGGSAMNQPISQGFKMTFVVHAIEGFATGIILLLFPTVFGEWINWDMSDAAYRIVGAAVLGCALSSWWASGAKSWRDVKILVQAKVVWMTIGAIVLLWAALLAPGRQPSRRC
jgi:hypothetical protein